VKFSFSGLAVIGQVILRLLDRLEQYDRERKKIRQEDRRRDINENPDPTWRDTFGDPSGRVRVNTEADTDNLRHHPSQAGVDGNERSESGRSDQ
jgi:hypothetical protein